ncbi:MAG: benzoate-CoA ligase family protein [Alphaproteobacteria bacterium]|nr:benzoate-CoA ligase family protein [Alphaproteobacteria bacterium]
MQSIIDRDTVPPRVDFPAVYNAAADLLGRNLAWPQKTAYVQADSGQTLSYGELDRQARQWAAALQADGFEPEQRVMLAMHDTLEWPVAFLGCILTGVVPIAVNTLLTTKDFAYMLGDSRAKGLIVSAALLPQFTPLLDGRLAALKKVYVDGSGDALGHPRLADLRAEQMPMNQPVATQPDDACFWLYSSGSTGSPKGTVHLHSHLMPTAVLYAQSILGICHDDIVFSAAKLFFAYGLGNALTFPMSVGATTVLWPGRPTPDDVFGALKRHRPSIFYGVPTLYASLLAHPDKPASDELNLRICTSAGEALPAEIGHTWQHNYGCEILDGIGSTEMLHIFLSNRPGQVRYGSTGMAVPGYELRLINDEGQECTPGELGELQIKGPSAALLYWGNRAKTKATFCGDWTRSGDKYSCDTDGYYTYGGRTDDMLKVGGIYVSPFEVEASLMTHAAVLEAAVIGVTDEEGLIKPKAYVVLKSGQSCTPDELKAHVKSQLAPYKYPRWIEIIDELPKTATGKIQRFKLRAPRT